MFKPLNMNRTLLARSAALAALFLLFFISDTSAQQYKIKQTSEMMGMKSETTIYVKGMRKRTEPGKTFGMQPPVTIEQCDLQRTIKINDKKKLYFIEPFAKDEEEIIDEDLPKTKQAPIKTKTNTAKQGGVIEIWNNITDTGERKKMYGFTARHIWTYRKIKPSADACNMKDSIITKTDGWYIDLPEFKCPEPRSIFSRPQMQPNELPKPDCKDRIVTHRKGKAKLGFPLIETTTMIMGGAMGKQTEMKTEMNTEELTTAKLDSMLFEIPPGYTETKNEEDLQDHFSIKDVGKEVMNEIKNNTGPSIVTSQEKKPGTMRIGVMLPTVKEEVSAGLLQKQMTAPLTTDKFDGISISDESEAEKYNCDYILETEITNIKAAGKLGGILKAIKNADPFAAKSYNVDATFTLKSIADGSVKAKTSISEKYEGKMEDAARQAMMDGCKKILKGLK